MTTQTSVNNQFLNDLTVTSATSAVVRSITCSNTSNTASSSAFIATTVAGTTASDAFFRNAIGTTRSYAIGAQTSLTNHNFHITSAASGTATPASTDIAMSYDPVNKGVGLLVEAQADATVMLTSVKSNAGNMQVSLENSDATGAAIMSINVATGGTSGNKMVFFASGGGDATKDWIIGQAGTASNAFKISQATISGNFGTNDTMIMTLTGNKTFPRSSLVSAYKSSPTNNATGDGTNVTVICDTVLFDQNSNYNNSTGVFTAPVTGKYLVEVTTTLTGIGAANTGNNTIGISATARSWTNNVGNLSAIKDAANNAYSCQMSAIIDMTAADTFNTNMVVTGGTKTVNIFGAANPNTWLSISLV